MPRVFALALNSLNANRPTNDGDGKKIQFFFIRNASGHLLIL